MTKEVIQQLEKLTPEEAEELSTRLARIGENEVAAMEYYEDVVAIQTKRLYRETHNTFDAWCRDTLGTPGRTVLQGIQVERIKGELLDSARNCANDSNQVIRAFAENASPSSIRETAKVRQDKRLDVILSAHEAAKGQKITAKLIEKQASKLNHKAKPEPERRGGFDACYGTGLTAQPVAITGKRVTLEEFRLMASQSGLNVPNSAVLHILVNGTLTKVTSVNFNRNDNELVLS